MKNLVNICTVVIGNVFLANIFHEPYNLFSYFPRNGQEFYRYIPTDNPSTAIFRHPGLYINVSTVQSTAVQTTLPRPYSGIRAYTSM